jgi:demethylmenaquinone methyltransferase/2-methoxy-6-polyprenyl-1,4-benzoquinol methylase
MTEDFTDRSQVLEAYRRLARWYDIGANLYYLIGFRERAYRREAVEALDLKPGATVVEIGCGTGLNFAMLQEKAGPKGRIIGVDLTGAMLRQARRRVAAQGWMNVELVECAAAAYEFPPAIDGVLSTFALTLEPEYERVIANGARALKPGGRWVVLDLKLSGGPLAWLAPLLVALARPFAVSMAMAERHPWETLERLLTATTMRERYFGFAYVATGLAPGSAGRGPASDGPGGTA